MQMVFLLSRLSRCTAAWNSCSSADGSAGARGVSSSSSASSESWSSIGVKSPGDPVRPARELVAPSSRDDADRRRTAGPSPRGDGDDDDELDRPPGSPALPNRSDDEEVLCAPGDEEDWLVGADVDRSRSR